MLKWRNEAVRKYADNCELFCKGGGRPLKGLSMFLTPC
jgi:hypothetical protein